MKPYYVYNWALKMPVWVGWIGPIRYVSNFEELFDESWWQTQQVH